MAFSKNDKNIRRAGRPLGVKNKVSPEREVERAYKTGKTISEIVQILSDKINADGKMDEATLLRYISKYLDIKMNLLEKALQADGEEDTKEAPKSKVIELKPVKIL